MFGNCLSKFLMLMSNYLKFDSYQNWNNLFTVTLIGNVKNALLAALVGLT